MAGVEYNPAEIEWKWLGRWSRARVFESDADPAKPKYFLTVPYPYASGALHVGHARSYTLGDVTARYQRMLGKNVLFPMASHITGTPILAISRKIEQGDKKAVEGNREYVSYYVEDKNKVDGIVASFSDPASVASFYANAIRQDFASMGYSIDWRRFFTTGDGVYNAFIRWQYKHLNERGFVVKGKHPVYFCPNCSNPVTTDDIKSGDEYSIEMSEFFLLKEPFEDGFLVAATLRPETVFGVVNVWINPDASYVKAMVDGETWFVSEKFAVKYADQQHAVEVLKKMKGSELVGKLVNVPLADRLVPLLAADFVDAGTATGVVNSVPAHAPYDYVAGIEVMRQKRIDLTPIPLIAVDGYSEIPAKDLVEREGITSQDDFERLEKVTAQLYKDEYYRGRTNKNCGQFANLSVIKAKEGVVSELEGRNLLARMYEKGIKDAGGLPVADPRCRCGSPIMIKVLSDQWFLDYGNYRWKELAREALVRMDIQPELYRKGFEHTIEWLHEWPCTRSRGLGTRLPLDEKWMIESLSDSTVYMAFYTIAHLIIGSGLSEKNLVPEFFDYVFLGEGVLEGVSAKTGVKPELVERMRREFLYWYPMDERRTGTAHISNHLTFMLFHHAAVFPSQFWPKKISLNEMLIAEGRKMSKSLGNVVPIHGSVRKNGADVVRLYLVYAADPGSTLDWRESQVDSARKRVKQFYDIVSHISGLGEGGGVSAVDGWLASRMSRAIAETRGELDSGNAREAVQHALYDIVGDYNWYVRRAGKGGGALKEFARNWVKLMTPFTPFTCEELWEKLGGSGLVSNEPYPAADGRGVDERAEACERLIAKVMEDVQNIIEVTKAKPKRISLFISPGWKYRALGLVREGKTVKDAMEDPELKQYGNETVKLMKARREELPRVLLAREEEACVLNEAVGFFSREFGCEVVVQETPVHDPQGKSKHAVPGKPGIYIE